MSQAARRLTIFLDGLGSIPSDKEGGNFSSLLHVYPGAQSATYIISTGAFKGGGVNMVKCKASHPTSS